VIAHRGASGCRPENTLSAYEEAIVQGADMVEIDLHRSRDGAIVVAHDRSLAALGGRGEIADALLADIRGLDAGKGERVPTLAEVLDAFGQRIAFNLELKQGQRGPYPELEAAALCAVRARNLLERTLFSSFYDPLLRSLREQCAQARLALLISRRFPTSWEERARGLGAEALHPECSLVDRELVERAHGAGLAVHPFTEDDPDRIERLLDLGVDGVFTNQPGRMRRLLARRLARAGDD